MVVRGVAAATCGEVLLCVCDSAISCCPLFISELPSPQQQKTVRESYDRKVRSVDTDSLTRWLPEELDYGKCLMFHLQITENSICTCFIHYCDNR